MIGMGSARSGDDFVEFRLPGGRHDLSPAEVAESQRLRLLGAAAQILAERGYARTTSAAIARRAHVSSAAFYVHFESVSDCLLAAYEMTADSLSEIVSEACEAPIEWPLRLGRAVDEVLSFLAAEPALAELLGPEAPAGIASIAAARARLVESLAGRLRGGDIPQKERGEIPGATERGLIDGAAGLIADRVRTRDTTSLLGLAPELTEILAIPYREASAA